ncbi:hypothetical protein [Nonomuraea roseoviolacea]|uniref:Minor tail protein n=1 Tax=Nonomuraea roseoviolacea subsp. carminata TaxID=160689 RepID=A0ABT1K9E3_9ACTN|nr:hypothetical protein [Nonomuraea roseoviolacea]MCP2350630.1 hypothetical protein [Nonomuraea roseoviolacea subsp. carminata]
MATRHNSCINPCLSNDTAGWGGEATPTRQAVTGFGRPFAAEYTSGTFLRTSAGAVAPGLDYTASVYIRPANGFSSGGSIYIEWRDAANGVISYSNGSYTLTSGVVTRASLTATAPSGAALAQIILDGANYAVTTVHTTMVLIEQTAALGDYFDGDTTPGGSWDGTPGSSASTLSDTVTGVLDGVLPAVTASFDGAVTVEGSLTANLPAVVMAASATVEVLGQIGAQLPPLTAALSGVVEVEGSIAAALPALTASLAGQVSDPPQAVLAAVLPAITASLTGTSDAVDPDLPSIVVGPPRLTWLSGGVRLGWLVGPPRLGGE